MHFLLRVRIGRSYRHSFAPGLQENTHAAPLLLSSVKKPRISLLLAVPLLQTSHRLKLL